MKKTLAIGLVALLAACSSDKARTVQWGTPQAPSAAEQAAVADSLLSLQSSLSYQGSTEPSAGAAGLGDQLVASLSSATAAAPGGSSAKLAQDVARRAFDTGGMDPNCVQPTDLPNGVVKYTWTNCVIDASDVDMTMHVTIDGWLTWDAANGTTAWQIGETLAMTMSSGGDVITMTGTARLEGTQTVTASTIVASTTSSADVRTSMRGPSGNFAIDETITTTLTADLDYTPDPFCVTGGKLTVVQDQNAGVMQQLVGFELTFGPGCNEFLLTKGS